MAVCDTVFPLKAALSLEPLSRGLMVEAIRLADRCVSRGGGGGGELVVVADQPHFVVRTIALGFRVYATTNGIRNRETRYDEGFSEISTAGERLVYP